MPAREYGMLRLAVNEWGLAHAVARQQNKTMCGTINRSSWTPQDGFPSCLKCVVMMYTPPVGRTINAEPDPYWDTLIGRAQGIQEYRDVGAAAEIMERLLILPGDDAEP